jgi:hypothetical protein
MANKKQEEPAMPFARQFPRPPLELLAFARSLRAGQVPTETMNNQLLDEAEAVLEAIWTGLHPLPAVPLARDSDPPPAGGG